MLSALRLRTPGARRCLGVRTLASAQIETVPLAYDLWEPRQGGSDEAPIVFLHGLFGSKNNNRSVSRVLARDLNKKVFCLDLRNHGHSPHHPRHDYLAMSADVLRFVSDHGLRNPILIGHSMGAKTAMASALQSPSLFSALIPVDNGPLTMGLSPDFGRYVDGMRAIDRAGVESQAEMYEIMRPYAPDVAVQQFLLSNFTRDKDSRKLRCRLPLDILGSKGLAHVADFDYFQPPKFRYGGPTLLIRGTRSHFVPDEALPLMGELFPKFVVRDIDSGHWVISEKPKEFIEEVERFLDVED